MHRNRSASTHEFAMVPRADIPRSALRMQKTLKTTFDAQYLYPVFCEEILPGDKWRMNMTAFGRLATPIFPVMDNLYLECFFFFVPNRLVWTNWQRFMGEQTSPGDSISFTIPQITNTPAALSLQDYFGIPTANAGSFYTAAGGTISYSALPFRMYNLIWNEWFRDENLTTPSPTNKGDGPDNAADYILLSRAKAHDYFTSAALFPQKGSATTSIPLDGPNIGGGIPGFAVRTAPGAIVAGPQATGMLMGRNSTGAIPAANTGLAFGAGGFVSESATVSGGTNILYPQNLYASLTGATAGTINALRTAFQVQKLLERDFRGGTRYTEIVRSHFGVISPDARLQRPEYLGGGRCPVAINPIAQTSGTSASGTTTPLGTLSSIGTGLLRSGFTQAFTEHGYVIGLINARADITYQQGLRRHWSRKTRYDFYFPVFAHLGEQAILYKEIAASGSVLATDDQVFGYQERWAEYRYLPNEITALFRSTHPQTIDAWHLAEEFPSLPLLNNVFITSPTRLTLQRAIAVGAAAGGQQFISDFFFDNTVVRPLPLYSVPGLVDHF